MRNRVACWARSDPLALAELAVAMLATPLLMFPNRFSVVALVLLATSWLVRVVLRRRTLRRSPADWPLVFLLLSTMVSLYPSVDLALSRPKYYGLILGFFVFGAIVEHARAGPRLAVLTGGIVISGVGIAILGIVGTDWFGRKLPIIGSIYDRLPHLITSVSTSFGTTESGFHPNEIAGTLALILPVAVGVALWGGRPFRGPIIAGALAMALVLLLTLSRSAILGAVFAGLVLSVLRWRRLWVAVPVAVGGAIVVTLSIGITRVMDVLLSLQLSSDLGAKAASRVEVWDRAWLMIQDFPLTGIGLNTFPIVTDRLYPLIISRPNARLPHAHDIFLQTAVDLGLPGLTIFVALLGVSATLLYRAWRATQGWEKGLVAGLGTGLLAHLIFGLTDAITLGAKPGILLWVVLGSAVGIGRFEGLTTDTNRPNAKIVGSFRPSAMGAGWVQGAQTVLFTMTSFLGIFIF